MPEWHPVFNEIQVYFLKFRKLLPL